MKSINVSDATIIDLATELPNTTETAAGTVKNACIFASVP